MGYTNVTDYSGGKQDWIDAGLQVRKPPEALSPSVIQNLDGA